MIQIRDEFLSDEDLDIKNLSEAELFTCWNQWLEQAQMTNEADKDDYSHGVFTMMNASSRSRDDFAGAQLSIPLRPGMPFEK